MLWLCLSFPRLPLELHAPLATCAAVFDQQGSRRWLASCNDAALQAGLQAGLNVTAALARVPHLILLPRSRTQERAAGKALAAWAGQYSSHVCVEIERRLLWIEIGGSLNYFGGLPALREQINQGIAELGYTAQSGIAPTLEAAALLAAHDTQRIVQQRNALPQALASLPLTALPVPASITEALQGVGWRYLGDVLALPHDQLARRFGPALTDYLQRLLGQRAEAHTPYRPPAIYQRHVDLTDGTEVIESLLFPLRRMLGELQGYLRSRDTALQNLQLLLHHHRQPATTLALHTSTPQRDAARLLNLLREHLERTPLRLPVMGLTLKVEQFVVPGDTQLDLFNSQPRHAQRWNELLDKLRARLGEQAVKRLAVCDDHRPEHAWCVLQADDTATQRRAHPQQAADEPERPLWLLPATPLESLPPLRGKPERIEAGWWSGEDIRRDYYIAETATGSRWWLYRDAVRAQWFLHGIWA